MRDFGITAEPNGSGGKAKQNAAPRTSLHRTSTSRGLPFVIQKHAASHLHYDFRLGWNGVLKSWAVAKGPSFYPGDRRLAIQVEDHPMEYGGFEGIIPQGQYGGGTVMVWDQGTWWPQPGHENVDAGLREGSLKFEMHGTKMKGKWTLVRMNPRSSSSSGSRWSNSSKPSWLLIKEHDNFERGSDDEPITEEKPNSAVTGRTMDQIAHASDHVWNSKETAGTGKAWYRQTAATSSANDASHTSLGRSPRSPSTSKDRGLKARSIGSSTLNKLPKESQPQFLPPELAEESTSPPEGNDWLHEIKLDGYRIQAR
jgi:bifunctional non-homologous end joining protein LigD